MTDFNPLNFIADHAGMNLADAIKEAYEQGKKDAEPKTGKWMPRCIDRKLMTTFVFECSNCGVHTYTRIPRFIDTMEYVYCPYCGARMLKDGEEHETD